MAALSVLLDSFLFELEHPHKVVNINKQSNNFIFFITSPHNV